MFIFSGLKSGNQDNYGISVLLMLEMNGICEVWFVLIKKYLTRLSKFWSLYCITPINGILEKELCIFHLPSLNY